MDGGRGQDTDIGWIVLPVNLGDFVDTAEVPFCHCIYLPDVQFPGL